MSASKMLFYAGIFVLGFIAISLWAFWLAVRPPRIFISGTPELYQLPAEDVYIKTADGLKLAAWFIPPQTSKEVIRSRFQRDSGKTTKEPAAVVLLHGYPAEKADMLAIATSLHPHFATLLLDMRYFGKSEGRLTTLGLRERDDLKRAVDFLQGRGYADVGVFGFSLGGAVGIMTAAEDSRIRAVAAYAPFSDLKMLGYELYSNLGVLKYPLVELMRFWSRLFLGGDLTAVSPLGAVEQLTTPLLLIASREDEQISFAHAERFKAVLTQNPKAEFYFLDRGRHGELPADFEYRLTVFFGNYLP